MARLITIPGFTGLSIQQLFDLSARHILTTRKRSTNDEGCTYSGCGCAAAPFLDPNERLYADSYGSWPGLVCEGLAPDHHASFIHKLQMCHDGAHNDATFMKDWAAEMRTLADRYKLDASILDAL